MPTRRGFLARLLATLPALPLLPRLASAAPVVPTRPVSAAPGIPRQMDLRRELHPLFTDIEVYRYGEKVLTGVAYDLDADTLTVIAERTAHGWGALPPISYRTLHGGVSVTWASPTMYIGPPSLQIHHHGSAADVAKAVVRELDRARNRMGGLNMSRADVLERM